MASQSFPAFFVGHGNPMNAILDTPWSRAWKALAPSLGRPKAVLCVSAHWATEGSFITAEERPKTIHDFGGFPPELYDVQYPAPGDPALAEQVAGLTGLGAKALRKDWGLDHGAWSVLIHLFPKADVPVVQLSLDMSLDPQAHVALGKHLSTLSDQGVLLMASGNVTHNLRHAFTAMQHQDAQTPDWAQRFDAAVAAAFKARDIDALCGLIESPDGQMSHPSTDHYLPLLYTAAVMGEGSVSSPVQGFDMASLSMRAFMAGAGR